MHVFRGDGPRRPGPDPPGRGHRDLQRRRTRRRNDHSGHRPTSYPRHGPAHRPAHPLWASGAALCVPGVAPISPLVCLSHRTPREVPRRGPSRRRASPPRSPERLAVVFERDEQMDHVPNDLAAVQELVRVADRPLNLSLEGWPSDEVRGLYPRRSRRRAPRRARGPDAAGSRRPCRTWPAWPPRARSAGRPPSPPGLPPG